MSFQAKYDGRCSECGETIQAGDTLEWDDSQAVRRAVHADCTRYEGVLLKPTCSKCWQEIALNGSCGCDPE
jgi:hypothetical protein